MDRIRGGSLNKLIIFRKKGNGKSEEPKPDPYEILHNLIQKARNLTDKDIWYFISILSHLRFEIAVFCMMYKTPQISISKNKFIFFFFNETGTIH